MGVAPHVEQQRLVPVKQLCLLAAELGQGISITRAAAATDAAIKVEASSISSSSSAASCTHIAGSASAFVLLC
jgi:hypothetical protein